MTYINEVLLILSILFVGLGSFTLIALIADALEARYAEKTKKRGATKLRGRL